MARIRNEINKLSPSTLIIKGMCVCALIMYLYCVLYITLIDRSIGMRRHVFRPLWEINSMIQSRNYTYWIGQIGGNLIMLLPLGFLLPILSDRFRSLKVIGVVGFTFSVFIELSQYYTGRGLFESDDIMHNTIGAIVGYLLFCFLSYFSAKDEISE